MASGPSITFSAYLTGGVPDGAPLWRDPPAPDGETGENAEPARAGGPTASTRSDARTGEADAAAHGTLDGPDE